MQKSHILIVAVDGLRASALGAYGNTTYLTPALDKFAAESMLFDACYAASADLKPTYHALWQSIHPLRPQETSDSASSLPRLLSEHGYQTTLVTDEPTLLDLPAAADFHEMAQPPADSSASSMMRLFAAASEAVTARRGGESERLQFVWAHSRGMYGPWEAPLAWQESMLDEGDPLPVMETDPPEIELSASGDPDTAYRYACAYAAQVKALDACWTGLLESIDAAVPHRPWLVLLMGVRGFPLGEHGRIGGLDRRLYVEQLHVPWLIRLPEGRGRLSRRSQLASHVDLLPTLLELAIGPAHPLNRPARFDGASLAPLVEQWNPPWRESLIATSDVAQAVRTPAWSLREEIGSGTDRQTVERTELYVRPDDRWEANDIADRCPDIAARLSQALMATTQPIPFSQTDPDDRVSS